MTRRNRRAVLRAHLDEPLSADEFDAIVWCQDCDATVHTTVVDGFAFVDVRHDSTCPAYRALTEEGD